MRTLPAGAAIAVLSLLGAGAASGAEPFCNRDCLAKVMNTYLQALLKPNSPDHKLIDVNPMFRQPVTFYIAEVFKVVDGDIRQIEAVLTTVPYQMESGW